jgi:hypothetical protein
MRLLREAASRVSLIRAWESSMSIAIETIMHARLPVRVLVASSLVPCGACASPPEQMSERREAKVNQTGSNIPKRDRGGVLDVNTVDRELPHRQMNPPTLPKPGTGAGR